MTASADDDAAPAGLPGEQAPPCDYGQDIDHNLARRIITELLELERDNLSRGASGAAGSRETHRQMAAKAADTLRRHLSEHYGLK